MGKQKQKTKASDPIWKIVNKAKGWEHGSNDRAPAYQLPGPEFKPSKKGNMQPGVGGSCL
jgi:hypothetical protein